MDLVGEEMRNYILVYGKLKNVGNTSVATRPILSKIFVVVPFALRSLEGFDLEILF